jgi:hypothetical protein
MSLRYRTILATLGKEPLLLDAFPNAAAAYSLRLLRKGYTGNCIQARRSSDNATQNIGFVNGVLDTASLLSFVGAGDGFVRTWYDQSENGRNATNTTNANQPQIVSSGSLIPMNGNPSILFSTTNWLSFSSITSNRWSFYATLKLLSTYDTFGGIIGSSLVGFMYHFNVGGFGYRTTSFYNALIARNSNQLNQIQITQLVDNNIGFGFSNGVNRNQNVNIQGADTFSYNQINYAFGGQRSNMEVQELILYNVFDNTNRVGIETNINNFYNIY